MQDDVKIFEAEDLAHTYIRAKDKDGNWGSFSFAELLSEPSGQLQIIEWFGTQMLQAAGVEQGGKVSEDAAVNICRIVEIVHGPLVKVKPTEDVK